MSLFQPTSTGYDQSLPQLSPSDDRISLIIPSQSSNAVLNDILTMPTNLFPPITSQTCIVSLSIPSPDALNSFAIPYHLCPNHIDSIPHHIHSDHSDDIVPTSHPYPSLSASWITKPFRVHLQSLRAHPIKYLTNIDIPYYTSLLPYISPAFIQSTLAEQTRVELSSFLSDAASIHQLSSRLSVISTLSQLNALRFFQNTPQKTIEYNDLALEFTGIDGNAFTPNIGAILRESQSLGIHLPLSLPSSEMVQLSQMLLSLDDTSSLPSSLLRICDSIDYSSSIIDINYFFASDLPTSLAATRQRTIEFFMPLLTASIRNTYHQNNPETHHFSGSSSAAAPSSASSASSSSQSSSVTPSYPSLAYPMQCLQSSSLHVLPAFLSPDRLPYLSSISPGLFTRSTRLFSDHIAQHVIPSQLYPYLAQGKALPLQNDDIRNTLVRFRSSPYVSIGPFGMLAVRGSIQLLQHIPLQSHLNLSILKQIALQYQQNQQQQQQQPSESSPISISSLFDPISTQSSSFASSSVPITCDDISHVPLPSILSASTCYTLLDVIAANDFKTKQQQQRQYQQQQLQSIPSHLSPACLFIDNGALPIWLHLMQNQCVSFYNTNIYNIQHYDDDNNQGHHDNDHDCYSMSLPDLRQWQSVRLFQPVVLQPQCTYSSIDYSAQLIQHVTSSTPPPQSLQHQKNDNTQHEQQEQRDQVPQQQQQQQLSEPNQSKNQLDEKTSFSTSMTLPMSRLSLFIHSTSYDWNEFGGFEFLAQTSLAYLTMLFSMQLESTSSSSPSAPAAQSTDHSPHRQFDPTILNSLRQTTQTIRATIPSINDLQSAFQNIPLPKQSKIKSRIEILHNPTSIAISYTLSKKKSQLVRKEISQQQRPSHPDQKQPKQQQQSSSSSSQSQPQCISITIPAYTTIIAVPVHLPIFTPSSQNTQQPPSSLFSGLQLQPAGYFLYVIKQLPVCHIVDTHTSTLAYTALKKQIYTALHTFDSSSFVSEIASSSSSSSSSYSALSEHLRQTMLSSSILRNGGDKDEPALVSSKANIISSMWVPHTPGAHRITPIYLVQSSLIASKLSLFAYLEQQQHPSSELLEDQPSRYFPGSTTTASELILPDESLHVEHICKTHVKSTSHHEVSNEPQPQLSSLLLAFPTKPIALIARRIHFMCVNPLFIFVQSPTNILSESSALLNHALKSCKSSTSLLNVDSASSSTLAASKSEPTGSIMIVAQSQPPIGLISMQWEPTLCISSFLHEHSSTTLIDQSSDNSRESLANALSLRSLVVAPSTGNDQIVQSNRFSPMFACLPSSAKAFPSIHPLRQSSIQLQNSLPVDWLTSQLALLTQRNFLLSRYYFNHILPQWLSGRTSSSLSPSTLNSSYCPKLTTLSIQEPSPTSTTTPTAIIATSLSPNFLNFLARGKDSFKSQLSSSLISSLMDSYSSMHAIMASFDRDVNTLVQTGNLLPLLESLPNISEMQTLTSLMGSFFDTNGSSIRLSDPDTSPILHDIERRPWDLLCNVFTAHRLYTTISPVITALGYLCSIHIQYYRYLVTLSYNNQHNSQDKPQTAMFINKITQRPGSVVNGQHTFAPLSTPIPNHSELEKFQQQQLQIIQTILSTLYSLRTIDASALVLPSSACCIDTPQTSNFVSQPSISQATISSMTFPISSALVLEPGAIFATKSGSQTVLRGQQLSVSAISQQYVAQSDLCDQLRTIRQQGMGIPHPLRSYVVSPLCYIDEKQFPFLPQNTDMLNNTSGALFYGASMFKIFEQPQKLPLWSASFNLSKDDNNVDPDNWTSSVIPFNQSAAISQQDRNSKISQLLTTLTSHSTLEQSSSSPFLTTTPSIALESTTIYHKPAINPLLFHGDVSTINSSFYFQYPAFSWRFRPHREHRHELFSTSNFCSWLQTHCPRVAQAVPQAIRGILTCLYLGCGYTMQDGRILLLSSESTCVIPLQQPSIRHKFASYFASRVNMPTVNLLSQKWCASQLQATMRTKIQDCTRSIRSYYQSYPCIYHQTAAFRAKWNERAAKWKKQHGDLPLVNLESEQQQEQNQPLFSHITDDSIFHIVDSESLKNHAQYREYNDHMVTMNAPFAIGSCTCLSLRLNYDFDGALELLDATHSDENWVSFALKCLWGYLLEQQQSSKQPLMTTKTDSIAMANTNGGSRQKSPPQFCNFLSKPVFISFELYAGNNASIATSLLMNQYQQPSQPTKSDDRIELSIDLNSMALLSSPNSGFFEQHPDYLFATDIAHACYPSIYVATRGSQRPTLYDHRTLPSSSSPSATSSSDSNSSIDLLQQQQRLKTFPTLANAGFICSFLSAIFVSKMCYKSSAIDPLLSTRYADLLTTLPQQIVDFEPHLPKANSQDKLTAVEEYLLDNAPGYTTFSFGGAGPTNVMQYKYDLACPEPCAIADTVRIGQNISALYSSSYAQHIAKLSEWSQQHALRQQGQEQPSSTPSENVSNQPNGIPLLSIPSSHQNCHVIVPIDAILASHRVIAIPQVNPDILQVLL